MDAMVDLLARATVISSSRSPPRSFHDCIIFLQLASSSRLDEKKSFNAMAAEQAAKIQYRSELQKVYRTMLAGGIAISDLNDDET